MNTPQTRTLTVLTFTSSLLAQKLAHKLPSHICPDMGGSRYTDPDMTDRTVQQFFQEIFC